MTGEELRAARVQEGWNQMEASRRLGVSQPYLAMLELGVRRVSAEVARRAVKVYRLPPTALHPARQGASATRVTPEALAKDVAALGYPGFAYLRSRRSKPKNPGDVLLAALRQDDLEPRLVEALPWLVLQYWTLDWDWVVREAKLADLQNRLGFVVSLARLLAHRGGDERKASSLSDLERVLEYSRLAREDTLCRATLPEAERRWLMEHRSDDARRWNLLTDWSADALRYVA